MIFFQTNNNPSIKDVTALEVYILACLGFVFLALMEFAVVLSLRKRSTIQINSKHELMNKTKLFHQTSSERMEKEREMEPANHSEITKDEYEGSQKKLDHLSFGMFSVAFILYNLGYIMYYCMYTRN